MIISEMQKNAAHRQYRQLMFRQMLMWLVGIALPVALIIAVFLF
ncbi:hypothetical protein [Rhizobium sp. PL01]|jgi:hypothetical protein|nr:hypothetical protein [Rhizobium sp. PL01]MDW5316511.1 hypothetical protein [Rhizobium sp. PL01]